MTYDNTKFYAAFDAWLEQNVEEGFGEHYAGDLLADFCEFCKETKMMKRSPGRVAFGRRLAEKGFDKRKYTGLTLWYGLELKKPRLMKPKRYKKTVEEAVEANTEREFIERQEQLKNSPEGRKLALDKFHEEMKEEEKRLRRSEDD